MIFRFVKFDVRALLQVPHDFFGKIDMSIQSCAHSRAAKGKLAQDFERFFSTRFSVTDLLRVTRKFLAEPDRGCIHQMSPADLDDVPKFFSLCFECGMQFRQSWEKLVLQLFGGADVNG